MSVQVKDDPGNVLHLVSSKLPYLPQALRNVAECILENPQKIQTMSITDLAALAGVAESTVSRFVREIGLEGYKELRVSIAEATFVSRSAGNRDEDEFIYDGISRNDSTADIVGKIQRGGAQSLRQTATRLNVEAVDRAVDLIQAASVIMFSCMGSSSIAGEEGVMRFTRAGKKCMLFRDQSIQTMLSTIVGPTDLVIGISDSGDSTAIVEVLRQAHTHGAATIGITSREDSPLFKISDVTLFTSNVPSGGALYGEAVISKWGQILVMDVLYAAYAARHFDETLNHLQETYDAAIRHSRT